MEHPLDLIREAAARGAARERSGGGRVVPFRRPRRRWWLGAGEWRLMVLGGVE